MIYADESALLLHHGNADCWSGAQARGGLQLPQALKAGLGNGRRIDRAAQVSQVTAGPPMISGAYAGDSGGVTFWWILSTVHAPSCGDYECTYHHIANEIATLIC